MVYIKVNKGGLSGVEVEPELIDKDIGNSGWKLIPATISYVFRY